MKKMILVGLCSSLLMLSLASCEKEETKPTPPTSTTGSTAGGGTGSNPLASKFAKGTAILNVDSVKDSLQAQEYLLDIGTRKYFTISHTGTNQSFDFITGDSKLPSMSKTFTIIKDAEVGPKEGEVMLMISNAQTEEELIAQSGTVTYTIGITEKVVKCSNVTFANEDGSVTKIVNYEARLK